MDPIARDVPATVVAEAWENNMLALFRLFGQSPAVEYVDTSLYARWHTGLYHPYFEGLQLFQPPPATADAFIEEQIDYFREQGAPIFACWLKPPLSHAVWQSILSAHGFSFDPGGPYMALKLDELPASIPWPEGLEIRVVDNPAALQIWLDIFVRGYGVRPEWVKPFAAIYQPLGWDLPLRHYIASVNGTPLAVSTLFLAEGVAGIWNVATLPEARGRGLGGAVTWQPLYDARKLGYAVAALDSTKMGYPLYHRLGFRDIPCSGGFIWQLKSQA